MRIQISCKWWSLENLPWLLIFPLNISNIRRYVSLASLAAKQLGSIHENIFVPMFQREVTPTTSFLFRNHVRSSRDKVALVTCHYDCHVIQATRHFLYCAWYFHLKIQKEKRVSPKSRSRSLRGQNVARETRKKLVEWWVRWPVCPFIPPFGLL